MTRVLWQYSPPPPPLREDSVAVWDEDLEGDNRQEEKIELQPEDRSPVMLVQDAGGMDGEEDDNNTDGVQVGNLITHEQVLHAVQPFLYIYGHVGVRLDTLDHPPLSYLHHAIRLVQKPTGSVINDLSVFNCRVQAEPWASQ
jgi:hypothetical protein